MKTNLNEDEQKFKREQNTGIGNLGSEAIREYKRLHPDWATIYVKPRKIIDLDSRHTGKTSEPNTTGYE